MRVTPKKSFLRPIIVGAGKRCKDLLPISSVASSSCFVFVFVFAFVFKLNFYFLVCFYLIFCFQLKNNFSFFYFFASMISNLPDDRVSQLDWLQFVAREHNMRKKDRRLQSKR
jgi:hypothetical protein